MDAQGGSFSLCARLVPSLFYTVECSAGTAWTLTLAERFFFVFFFLSFVLEGLAVSARSGVWRINRGTEFVVGVEGSYYRGRF